MSPENWVGIGAYKEYFQPIIEGTTDGAIHNIIAISMLMYYSPYIPLLSLPSQAILRLTLGNKLPPGLNIQIPVINLV